MPGPGYKGEIVAIQCGVGGLSANLNPSRIKLKNVIQAESAVFRQDHWRKEPGSILFGTNTNAASASDALIVAMSDWHPTEAIQRMVHLRGDGKIYLTDDAGTDPGKNTDGTAASSSGSGTKFGFFVTGGSESASQNRKLFLLRNNLLPVYLDGDTTSSTKFGASNFTFSDWTD